MINEDFIDSVRAGKKPDSVQRVLLVEDSKAFRHIIQKILKDIGFEVHTAEHGKMALELLETGNIKFDLALMDVKMPVMDGFETLKKIRANPALKDMPVIMCTSKSEREAILELAQIGIQGFIAKPINVKALISKVQEVMA